MPKLGEGEKSQKIRDFYANPDSGRLRSGLFRSGKVHGAHIFQLIHSNVLSVP